MLIKIAWRNIWRNKLRSSVVILSIAIGLWAGVFTMALMNGMTNQRAEGAIGAYISHIQIHSPDYVSDPDASHYIADTSRLTQILDTMSAVDAYTERMVVLGMGSTANGASGLSIYGIDPTMESAVTTIHESLVAGSYFDGSYRTPVVIGEKLATKLGIRERSKLVLTFQAEDGDLTAGAFRVVGIFKSVNSTFDEATVFVPKQSLVRLYGAEHIQEVAVMLSSVSESKLARDQINTAIPEVEARYWGQISPELGYADDVLEQSMYVFVAVILLAMAFGIVNSMLMAVLERKHELGMLLCIGLSKARIFWMILFETVFVTSIGGPLGLLMAYSTVKYFANHGIDLSIVGEGLASLGMATVVYPALGGRIYLNITIMVIITAMIAALYPARKAISYPPADAIRSL
jgi:ABC-type lipoprotein release transport system permease subunit